MKQIEKCPFVENNEKECDVPPCNTCYLNCIHKPYNLKGGTTKNEKIDRE